MIYVTPLATRIHRRGEVNFLMHVSNFHNLLDYQLDYNGYLCHSIIKVVFIRHNRHRLYQFLASSKVIVLASHNSVPSSLVTNAQPAVNCRRYCHYLHQHLTCTQLSKISETTMSSSLLNVGRSVMLVSNLMYSVGSFFADWNETHIHNPQWPGTQHLPLSHPNLH